MALDTNFKTLLFKNRNYTILPHEDDLLPDPEHIMREQVYPLFVNITCLFINTESQTTNQLSSKKTKYQIINEQYIHTYICINILSVLRISSDYSNLVQWPGIPKILNYSKYIPKILNYSKYMWPGRLGGSVG